ncbi:polyketide synthase [Fusarium circinatum]|uniref:Polyketide synthase n=1 Tax=Fusarium circinatum TaxID=48490 RepID=A0A8H5U9D8_FUSCI|nr:polyketide synthase [Fusarium circinatum]
MAFNTSVPANEHEAPSYVLVMGERILATWNLALAALLWTIIISAATFLVNMVIVLILGLVMGLSDLYGNGLPSLGIAILLEASEKVFYSTSRTEWSTILTRHKVWIQGEIERLFEEQEKLLTQSDNLYNLHWDQSTEIANWTRILLSRLWSLLQSPKDFLRDFPKDRLNLGAFCKKDGEHQGATDVCNKGHLLEEDSRLFDASIFNINPAEADSMEPQKRLTLETVDESLGAAGYTSEEMQGSVAAPYCGSINTVIGHPEGCAGLAVLLKESSEVQNATIPPILLYKTLNPPTKPFHDHLQLHTTATRYVKLHSGHTRRRTGAVTEKSVGLLLIFAETESSPPTTLGNALRDIPDAPTWNLANELMASEENFRVGEAAISHHLCTTTQIAFVDILSSAGVQFDAVVGHSSGEICAVYAAGLLSATDAMRITYYRGLNTKYACRPSGAKGSMMAVGMGSEDRTAFYDQEHFKGRISLAASNSPSSATISGDEDAILEAKEILEEQKIFVRLLKVDTGYHSHHMRACAEPYLESLKACNITVNPPSNNYIWVSSVYGNADMVDDEDGLSALSGQYWIDNLVRPVLFSGALECSLWRAGPFNLSLEIEPHPALKGPASQTMKTALGHVPPYATFLRRGYDGVEAFSGGIGYVWAHLGSHVDFAGHYKAIHVHWKESRISRRYRLAEKAPHELLGRRAPDDSDSEIRWRDILRLKELPWIRGHAFQGLALLPTSGYLAMAIQAAMKIAGSRPVELVEIRDLVIPRALTIEENNPGIRSIFSVKKIGGRCILLNHCCYVIDRLAIAPNTDHEAVPGEMNFDVDTYVTETTSKTFSGDVHIINSDGKTGLQAEGPTLKLFTEASSSDDRHMFSKTIWRADILDSSKNLDEINPNEQELALAEAIDRTSFYFIRKAFDHLSEKDVNDWEWFHQASFKTVKEVLQETRDGKHLTAQKEWFDHTEESIQDHKDKYS